MPIMLESSSVARDHLVIPDDHACPEDNFRRYEWLGQYILDFKPPVIIKLGDSWDMASLCSYDRGTKSSMMRSVHADIEAGHKAETTMFAPLVAYNKRMRETKHATYKPLLIKLIGNHEYRMKKLLDTDPKLEGLLSMNCFNTRIEDVNEIVVDYLDFIKCDDIIYSHLMVSGVKGQPFSSARTMVTKTSMSCTMGHTHVMDFHSLVKPTGQRIRGLIAGSFHDPEHESFAGRQVDRIWWNGIVHKHNVLNGDYDMEEVSINRLQGMYNK